MYVSSRTKTLALLSLMNCWIFLAPAALSHGGHGNEFSEQEKTGSSEVKIEAETAQRIGVKVFPVQKQSLKVEIVATGQIELLPNQKFAVIAFFDSLAYLGLIYLITKSSKLFFAVAGCPNCHRFDLILDYCSYSLSQIQPIRIFHKVTFWFYLHHDKA
jgi:hypothetical protein